MSENKPCCSSQKEAGPVVETSCCGSSAMDQAAETETAEKQTAAKETAGGCCSALATSSASTPCSSSSGSASSNSGSAASGSCCDDQPGKQDWLLLGCAAFVVLAYVGHWLVGDAGVDWLNIMMHTSMEMVHAMWWGILSAAFFVGLLGRIPRELVMSVLGKGGTATGLFRATLAGLMLDLCNHGILMVGMKLYERGASLGQVMAFLIASPWNSLTLTLILVGLIGLQWTLIFILASLVIAWVSGWIFERLVHQQVLPENPHQVAFVQTPFWPTLKETWHQNDWSSSALLAMFWQGLKESRSVLRWVLLGIVMVALIRAFVPEESFGVWFGASMSGLFLTLLATTVIEVCSEGSSPIAADLVNRAAAPGNAFTFLMAGAATDYTEIMALRDTTQSWKIALFLPLVTVPQVLVLGYIMNISG